MCVCACDQRSFGIAHLGVKLFYFGEDSAESAEQLCLWLTRFQLPSQALGVCFSSSWFVKGYAGGDCRNSEMNFSCRSYRESSPLVEKEIEIVSLRV